MNRLIITNGGSAAKRMREAGIDDTLLLWRDVLHDGPVPRRDSLEALSAVRAAFIAQDLGLDHSEPGRVEAEFAERDRLARDHARFERVEIWLEHDLYDQLQLIQILDFFAVEKRDDIALVQTHEHLGALSASAMAALDGTARTVAAEQFGEARRAWEAFTAPSPEALVALAGHEPSGLPFLRAALMRLLAEFPDPVAGLSLTEQRVLMAMFWEASTPSALFRQISEAEDARFMGDISFFRRLDGLAFVPHPLIEGLDAPFGLDGREDGYQARAVQLTQTGLAALDGRFDHAGENGIERWIGGTRIASDAAWRWDRETLALHPPD